LPRDTFFELAENLRFAVGIILMTSVIRLEKYFRGSGVDGLVAISGYPSSSKLLSLKSPRLILSGFAVEKEQIRRFYTKRLGLFTFKRNKYA